MLPKLDVQKFWDNVDVCKHGWDCEECCWEWVGGTYRVEGYGQFYADGKLWRATWLSYQLFFGENVDPKLYMLHDCDNPPCCSPYHVWPGSQLQNIEDRQSKGRQYRPKGSLHGEAKLTEWKVQRIFQLFASGTWSYIALGERFGVSNTKIQQIIKGTAWTHVQSPFREHLEQSKKAFAKQKLTDAEVVEIQKLYATGKYRQNDLGERFGVSGRQISAIVRGEQHTHLHQGYVDTSTKGVFNGNARLTEREVRRIHQYDALGWASRAIAVEFGVSQKTILDILHGKTWKHVPKPKMPPNIE
jgi:hypothetical protein